MKIDIHSSAIEDIKTELGIAGLGFLHFTPDIINKLSAKFADTDLTAYPEYIHTTVDLRSNPLNLHPWTKSAIIAAIPFNHIPDKPPFLRPAEHPELSGKIAGYAMKSDYHSFGKNILAKFAEKLKKEINCKIRTEISIDTAPVAERTLAVMAGIGRIGKNSCLLTTKNGSGCFIGEIFTDIEININGEFKKEKLENSCNECGRCIKNCPTGALTENEEFSYKRCRSNLTIEKRGLLTLKESRLIDDWVFGCDLCTSCCPGSDLPSPFEVDLKWLLMCPSSELKKSIKGTTLEYSGVTILRRNALIVLGNRYTPVALNLIKKFSAITGSDILKKLSYNILAS